MKKIFLSAALALAATSSLADDVQFVTFYDTSQDPSESLSVNYSEYVIKNDGSIVNAGGGSFGMKSQGTYQYILNSAPEGQHYLVINNVHVSSYKGSYIQTFNSCTTKSGNTGIMFTVLEPNGVPNQVVCSPAYASNKK